MDKPTIDFYDKFAEVQSDLYETADMSVMHRRLATIVPPCGRILEIGCGSGRDARVLAGMGFSVIATDASSGMIREAERRTEVNRDNLSFTCLSFPLSEGHLLLNERFDCVLAVAVLMHLLPEERVQTLGQVQRMLKPNGLFYCTLKNRQSTDARLYQEIKASDFKSECLRCGLLNLLEWSDSDVLGRGTCWETMLFTNGANNDCHSLRENLFNLIRGSGDRWFNNMFHINIKADISVSDHF